MSSKLLYTKVMKNRRSAWITLTGILLTASVCDGGCIKHNFKQHVTDNLLMDHWFQMNNFTPPGEEVTPQHEFLSVFNSVCASLIANEQFNISDRKEPRSRLMWTYIQMINELVNDSKQQINTLQYCKNKSCSEFYSTSFINIMQFETIYKKVCKNGTVAACPSLQTSTAAMSLKPTSSFQCLVVPLTIFIIIIIIIYFSVKAYTKNRHQNNLQNHVELNEKNVVQDSALINLQLRDDEEQKEDDGSRISD